MGAAIGDCGAFGRSNVYYGMMRLSSAALISLAAGWSGCATRNVHETPPLVERLSADDKVVPHELVVDFRDDEPHQTIAELGRRLGVTFRPVSDFFDTDEIYTVESDDPEALLAGLRADPDVEAADFNVLYSIPQGEQAMFADDPSTENQGFPNDPKFKYQWHLEQIHVKQAWKFAQGAGVTVAVIDTGVARVPDLAETEIVAGYNFVDNNKNAADDHGHGTHVAGTIAQSTNNGVGVAGIAFKAKIMPIKVLSARGSGSIGGIAEGIRFAADHGAKVINMSLGGPLSSSVLGKAIKYAHDKGVVVVCAAGNDGRGRVSFPAAFPDAIAVAATQFDESTTFYSNWGKEIDIAAPGGNTRVDQNGDGMNDGVLQNTIVPGDISKNDYLLFMGTSMAAPHVAGVAALLVSQGVTSPDAVEKVLKASAHAPKIKPKDDANRYGAGILDAGAALKKAQVEYGAEELGLSALAFGAIALLLRRRALFALGFGGVTAMLIAASGLFFAPSLGFASHGLAAFGDGNPIFASALIPLACVALFYSVRTLRGVLAGLAIGFGGHLLFEIFSRTTGVRFVPDFLDGAWLTANAALSFALGYATLRR